MPTEEENLVLRLQQDCACRAETVELDLDLPGAPLTATIFASGRAGLDDLLPLARKLCDTVTARTIARSGQQGQPVCCRKSCGACCRYLAPLSAPEALRFHKELDSLPAVQSRRVQKALLDTARKLLAGVDPALTTAPPAEASRWYASLELPCPLMSQNCCILYASRPLACREHFAIDVAGGPARTGCPGNRVLPLPVSVLEALAELSAQVQALPLESIMLPLALPWLEDNRARLDRTWPAVELARTFVEILNRQLSRNAEARSVASPR